MVMINQKTEATQKPKAMPEVIAEADCDAGLDETTLFAADDAVQSLAAEFIKQLPDDIFQIEEALSALEAAPGDEDCFNNFFRLLHDLKGMAGTFDYMLITVIGNDLCRFIERQVPITERRLKVVRFHVAAMKLVEEKHMTGENHPHGLRIIDTLHSMTQKVLQEE